VKKRVYPLDAVFDYSSIDADLMNLFDVYQSQALDPNVNRKRLMEEEKLNRSRIGLSKTGHNYFPLIVDDIKRDYFSRQ